MGLWGVLQGFFVVGVWVEMSLDTPGVHGRTCAVEVPARLSGLVRVRALLYVRCRTCDELHVSPDYPGHSCLLGLAGVPVNPDVWRRCELYSPLGRGTPRWTPGE